MAEDADTAEVEGGIAVAKLLQDRNVVPYTAVGEVPIAEIAERLRPPGHAQAVDHDDHEAKLRQRLRVPEATAATRSGRSAERRRIGVRGRYLVDLRTTVNVVDDGVRAVRIEPGGPEDGAIDVGDTVAGLRREPLGRPPAGRKQRFHVGPLELADLLASGAANQRDWWQVQPRIRVQEIPAGGSNLHGVRGVLRGEQLRLRPVEADAVQVRVVRVAALLAAYSREVEPPAIFVHVHDLGDVVRTGRKLPEQRAGLGVVQVEVTPAVSRRIPDDLRATGDDPDVDGSPEEIGIDGTFRALFHHGAGGARCGVDFVQP